MDISIEEKFNELFENWRNETGGYSIILYKYEHPSYQKIIDMGDSIVPILLEKCKNNNFLWYYDMLKTIVGCEFNEDLVGEDWIDWGKQQRYIADDTLSY